MDISRAREQAKERRRLAREAYGRITEFLKTNVVQFNGAGEHLLPSVDQSWNVEHTDPKQCDDNYRTISGIAKILAEYRHIRCVDDV